ncbi:MAG: hypothetical protein GX425_17760 [Peptococcaceae bacterium]|nr:hypothetical protein [Peptococcaceae bacterium]
MKKRFAITAGVILALVMITGVIWAQKNSGNEDNAQNEMNSLPENITMPVNTAESGNTVDASAIKVDINGEPVSFTDIQPYIDGSAACFL